MKLKKDNSCFIIGEAGINHDGDINIAKELIDVAAEAKVDAVKFQLFDTNKYISDDAFMADYHIKARVKNNETFKDLLKRLELNKSNFHEIYKYAQKKNIMIFSTPFDVQSANFLNKIGNRIFKVASFNLTNFVLIENLAKKKTTFNYINWTSFLG